VTGFRFKRPTGAKLKRNQATNLHCHLFQKAGRPKHEDGNRAVIFKKLRSYDDSMF